MKFFSKSKNKQKKQIMLLDNVIELSEDDLRFRVNGGSALTPQQQYEMAQSMAQGDYSAYNQLTGGDYGGGSSDSGSGGSGGSGGSNYSSGNTGNSPASTTAPANIDQREASDPTNTTSGNTGGGGYSPSMPSGYNPDPSPSSISSNSYNIDDREKIDEIIKNPSGYNPKSGNIDEREYCEQANKEMREKLLETARSKIGTKYEKNEINPYQCDNYVQDVFQTSDVSYEKYFAGDANDKNVDEHIGNALANNRTSRETQYNAPDLSDSTYIVFMNDGKINPKTGEPYIAHTGLVILNDGVCTYIDNSSGNPNEGVFEQTYSSLSAFQSDYAYKSFYYQEVDLFN